MKELLALHQFQSVNVSVLIALFPWMLPIQQNSYIWNESEVHIGDSHEKNRSDVVKDLMEAIDARNIERLNITLKRLTKKERSSLPGPVLYVQAMHNEDVFRTLSNAKLNPNGGILGKPDISFILVNKATAIGDAAWWRRRAFLKKLISNGLKIGKVDENGDNVLHYAAQWEQGEVVEYFVEQGVKVVLNKRGLGPLQITSGISFESTEDESRKLFHLLNAGDSLAGIDSDGRTLSQRCTHYQNRGLRWALSKMSIKAAVREIGS